MGGGPSSEQKQAAASQANLTSNLSNVANRQQDFFEKQQNLVNPFFVSRMTNGLPFYNNLTDAASGSTAQAFAPAKAQLLRQIGSQQGLPSGFRQGALTDFNEGQARAFDSNLINAQMMNEQAKQGGAQGIMGQQQLANPFQYYQGGLSGNQSIMQAPLQRPGLAGVFGGLVGGLASNPAIFGA